MRTWQSWIKAPNPSAGWASLVSRCLMGRNLKPRYIQCELAQLQVLRCKSEQRNGPALPDFIHSFTMLGRRVMWRHPRVTQGNKAWGTQANAQGHVALRVRAPNVAKPHALNCIARKGTKEREAETHSQRQRDMKQRQRDRKDEQEGGLSLVQVIPSRVGLGVHLVNSDCTDFSRVAKQHRQHRPQE